MNIVWPFFVSKDLIIITKLKWLPSYLFIVFVHKEFMLRKGFATD